MHAVRKSERGFTLIEIMAAMLVGLVVIAGIFGTMVAQQQNYFAEMEMAGASQNARASLDIIRQSLRAAGWGMVPSPTAQGLPPVGTCFAASVTDESTCNDLAAQNANGSAILSDKIRIVGIQGGPTYSHATHWASSTQAAVNDTTRTQLVIGDLAILSGTCTAGVTGVYDGVVKITGVSVAGTTVTYTFSASVTGYPAFACTAMTDGFSFGLARIVEFYIDRSLANSQDPSPGATNVPRLLMITNRNGRDPSTGNAPLEQTVAYDIENLQVRYGLDCGQVPSGGVCSGATSQNADDILDNIAAGQQYCNDLRAANCASGYTDIQNQMRAMAVQVAVVPRTRSQDRRTSTGATVSGSAITVFGSVIPADSYKHWIYRATVALRNNQLPVSSQ